MLLVHTELWNCGSEIWGTVGLFLVTVKIWAVALGLQHCCHFANTAHQSRTPNLSLEFVFPLTSLGPMAKDPHMRTQGTPTGSAPFPAQPLLITAQSPTPSHTPANPSTAWSYGVETLTLWGWSLCILNAPRAAGDHGMSEMQSPVQPQGPSSPPRMEEVTAALLQPSASQPSPPLPPSPHQGLTLGQMLGWEGCLELKGSCGVGGCARQKTAGKWSPHVANGI